MEKKMSESPQKNPKPKHKQNKPPNPANTSNKTKPQTTKTLQHFPQKSL